MMWIDRRLSDSLSRRAVLAGGLLASVLLTAPGCRAPAEPLRSEAAESGWPAFEPEAFDAFDPVATRRIGDRVRYRVETNAGGAVRGWDLTLRVRGVVVTEEQPLVCDPILGFAVPKAHRIWMSFRDGPRLSVLNDGDVEMQIRLERDDGDVFETEIVTGDLLHAYSESVEAMPAFGIPGLVGVLLGIERLYEELVDLVQPPSLLSVIANGMRVGLRLDFGEIAGSPEPLPEVEVIDSPFGEVPAFWLPFRLLANGQPALECRALVTWRRSPLLHVVGVLRIEAWHPADETRRIHAWLIEARRGEGASPDPANLGHGLRRGMSEDDALRVLGSALDERSSARGPQGEELGVVLVAMGEHHLPLELVFDSAGLCFVGFPGVVDQYFEHRDYRREPASKS